MATNTVERINNDIIVWFDVSFVGWRHMHRFNLFYRR